MIRITCGKCGQKQMMYSHYVHIVNSEGANAIRLECPKRVCCHTCHAVLVVK